MVSRFLKLKGHGLIVGLERILNNNVYLGESKTLGKRWVVKAKNVNDAATQVLVFCKDEIVLMESITPDKDLDLDLKFMLVEDSVLEL